VLRFAKRPLNDSHTNCRALADYDRCCTDEQLRMISRKGGVVGAHFGFLEPPEIAEGPAQKQVLRDFYKKLAAMKRRYKHPYEFLQHRNDPWEWPRSLGGFVDDGQPIRRAPMKALGDHIERLVKIAGIDHVGIGTDYSAGNMPVGVETVETLHNLTAELIGRSFTPAQVKKIWGENFLRLYRECLPA
jgi:membrane dipeptidase